MPTQPPYPPAGMVFHVINRGVGRQAIFHKYQDYTVVQRVMAEAERRVAIRLLTSSKGAPLMSRNDPCPPRPIFRPEDG